MRPAPVLSAGVAGLVLTALFALIAPASVAGADVVVTSTADSGPGSLRAAIDQSNSDGVPTVITFDPGLAGQTIYVLSQLPQLDAGSATVDGDIDGDCIPDIALSGELGGTHGLQVPSPGNVIRGLAIHSFHSNGLDLRSEQADGNVIECNYLGVGLDGITPLPNGIHGMNITNGDDNHVGPGNVISANTSVGLIIEELSSGNVVEGNWIGTDRSGGHELGNSWGVFLVGGAVDNRVGPGNTAAFNSVGVRVEGAERNTITRNTHYGSGRLGIELWDDGTIPPNGLLPAPVLDDSVEQPGIDFDILGTAPPESTVELFGAAPLPGGFAEGEAYLGSTTADLSGNFIHRVAVPENYSSVTATATDLLGNTSEFSLPLEVRVVPDWVWTGPSEENTAAVSGDLLPAFNPLLGSVAYGTELQNWLDWRGTSGDVVNPRLTLETTYPVTEVEASDDPLPGTEYEWQFSDIPNGGQRHHATVYFDPQAVLVSFTPGFTISRAVTPAQVDHPGGLVSLVVHVTADRVELDGATVSLLEIGPTLSEHPDFILEVVDVTALSPQDMDIYFDPHRAGWNVWHENIVLGETYSVEVTLDVQLRETARTVEYMPFVEARARYSVDEVQVEGTSASFGLEDWGTWTWEADTEHTWAWRTGSWWPRAGLEERIFVTPNQAPVALCRDVVAEVIGPGDTIELSVDDGSYDPEGDDITLAQDPPSPYGVGFYDVRLTVQDSLGLASECWGTVTVDGPPPPPVTYVVTTSADGGLGSLRETMQAAIDDGTESIITFDPALSGQTIVLSQPLPQVRSDATSIDGDLDGDCRPDVALDGTATGDDAFYVTSSDNLIRGLAIYRFFNGITLDGGSGNVIECNYIGTDLSGTAALGNDTAGVSIRNGASGNRVGGDAATAGNVIVDNRHTGISITNASDNLVAGNRVGIDPSGTLALGNAHDGIIVENESSNNTIGPDNIVAHSGGMGIGVYEQDNGAYPGFDGLTPDATGVFHEIRFPDSCGVFQHADGTVLFDVSGHTFFDYFGARFTGELTVPVAGDYTFSFEYPDDVMQLSIDGVLRLDTEYEFETTVSLSDGDHDFELAYIEWGGAANLDLRINGPAETSFSHGGQPGVLGEFFQLRVPSEGNTITRNSTFDNGWLGIGFSCCCGVTQNDPGDVDVGPNGLLNYPELIGSSELGGDSFEVTGTAPADSTVELFAAAPDESGHGEGKQYLGSVTADPAGEFTTTVSVPAEFLSITATATDGDGSTSEFSRNLGVRPNSLTVDNAGESGPGSLAEAFEIANSDGAPTLISFDPSLAGQTIYLDNPLPDLWEDGTTIDGDLDGDCTPDVEIRGNGLSWAVGVALGGSDNLVRGLAINGFAGGIQIMGSNDNAVECNWIGLDLAGGPVGNDHNGIQVEGNGNRIGPDNVVANNGASGVSLTEGSVHTTLDFAGLEPQAAGVYPSIAFTDEGFWPFDGCGSYLRHVDGDPILDDEGRPFWDRIGGRFTATLSVDAPGDYEFVLDVRDHGLLEVDGETLLDVGCCDVYTAVRHLEAGDHDLTLGFTDGGVAFVQLDVTGPGNATLTAPGGEPGVFAEFFKLRVPSERNTITQNSIYDNGWLGIHFGFCGVVPNDPGDLDDGVNTLLNYPELTGFTELGGDSFEVTGTAPPESAVELFAAAPDQSGFGEGKLYLGTTLADLSGVFATTISLPAGYFSVTATATDPNGNTSQFSRGLGVRPNEITVENADAYGPGSFYDAVERANSDGGPTLITFEGYLEGSTIELDETLELREDATSINGDLDGDCWPDIELVGGPNNGWAAFVIVSSNNLIRGLVLSGFNGPALDFVDDFDPEIFVTGNVVECNFIGTDASGTVATGGSGGVLLQGVNTYDNRIGGPPATSRNVISGNQGPGIYVEASGNVIEGNLIGTDVYGDPLGNYEGVRFWAGSDNRVGPGNVIANHNYGVLVEEGTREGYPDFDGLTPAAAGVFDSIDFIGDCDPLRHADGTLVTDGSGVPFDAHFGARFTAALTVDVAGDYDFDLPDPDDEVQLTLDGEVVLEGRWPDSLSATVTLDTGAHEFELVYRQGHYGQVRFEISGPGNALFTHEGAPGIYGEFFDLRLPSERNTITQNSIYESNTLGIGLGGCEPLLNDPGDLDAGANTWLNYPELALALVDGGATTIEGSLDTPSPELATVELFSNSVAHESGYGEGETYIGSVTPDLTGAFSVALAELAVGQWVTATATDAAGNTSGFSLAVRVTEPVKWATALYAAPQSATSVLLTWIDPDHAETGFRIERSLDGASWTAIATVGPDETSYLDGGLTAATLYYYRVIAFTDGVDERPSNVASATTFPATAAKVCHQQVTTMHRGARIASPAFNGQHWGVAWMERDGAYDELYFRLFQGDGTPVAPAVRLTDSDSITQVPTLRWNGSSFGLVYGEHMRGPQGQFWSSSKFMSLDPNGQPIRKEMLIDAGAFGSIPNQFDEPLAWDGSHWGYLVHRVFDPQVSDVIDLVFYRLTEDGEIALGPVRLTNAPNDSLDASLAWSGTEFGLSWLDAVGGSPRVLFQRMQSDGTLLGAPTVVGEAENGYTVGTNVVWDGAGWAVAWSESQGDGSEAVLLRRLDPAGVPLGPEARISDDYDHDIGPGFPVWDEYPQLAAKSGGYAIYTMSYSFTPVFSFEVARLTADANGEKVGQRTFVSDRDGLNSLFNRVATDGTNDLVVFNDSRSGSQEIASALVDAPGAVVHGPVELTSGHDAGGASTWTTGAAEPQVVAVGSGFAALWREPYGGGQVHGRIFDGNGTLVASHAPISNGTVAAGPVAIGVGDTFAAAWLDEGTGQITFERFNATGDALLGAVLLDGGGAPEAIGFSGEVYAVAWSQGGGIGLQAVTPSGVVVGPPVTIEGAGDRLVDLQWTGAGWALIARQWPDLSYSLVDTDGSFLVPPTPISSTPQFPRSVATAWNGAALGVAWEESRDGAWPPEIYFTVLDGQGNKAFEEIELWSEGRFPTVYWQDGSFHVTLQNYLADPGGSRLVSVLPDGTVTGQRVLSAHIGIGHAASNGATAGFLYVHRAEAYFETTACLDDTSPPPAPEISALFDGEAVQLSWTAVDDPESTVIGYNLYRDGVLIAESFATTFQYADFGWLPETLFEYEIRALNGSWLESGTTADNVILAGANQPPVAVCADVSIAAGSVCEAVASVDAGSYDPDGDPFTVVETPAGPYPLGDTQVTLTITDDQNASDSCTATVTVFDATPPVIDSCAADRELVVDELTGLVAVPALASEVEASDNCSLAVTQSPAAGSFIGAGDTTVTLSVSDGVPHTVTCDANLRVLDRILSSEEKIKVHFHGDDDEDSDSDSDSDDSDHSGPPPPASPQCFSKLDFDGELQLRDLTKLPADVRGLAAEEIDARLVLSLGGFGITDEVLALDVKDRHDEKWEFKRPRGVPKEGLHRLKIDWTEVPAYDSHDGTGLGTDVPQVKTRFIGFDETTVKIRYRHVVRPFTLRFVDPVFGDLSLTVEDAAGTTTVEPPGDYELKARKRSLKMVLPFRLTPATEISYSTDAGTTFTPIPVDPDVNYMAAGAKYMLTFDRTALTDALCLEDPPFDSDSEPRLALELRLGAGVGEVVGVVALEPGDWTSTDWGHWKLTP